MGRLELDVDPVVIDFADFVSVWGSVLDYALALVVEHDLGRGVGFVIYVLGRQRCPDR